MRANSLFGISPLFSAETRDLARTFPPCLLVTRALPGAIARLQQPLLERDRPHTKPEEHRIPVRAGFPPPMVRDGPPT